MKNTQSLALALALLSLALQGCAMEKLSPECVKQCANLPASSFGEVRACQQQCMNPNDSVEIHEKADLYTSETPTSILS